MNTDVTIANHGSIVLLTPVSAAAQDWFGDNLPDDAPRFGRGFAIEPRYVQPILDGLDMDGFTYA